MTPERINRITSVVDKRQQGIVVLEDIHDPHNAQAVIRSCDCFGFQTIYLIFDKEKKFDPEQFGKLASSSANKWVDYKIFNSTQEAYQELKELGYKIYATVIDDNAESIFETKFEEEKLAIAFGNEHSGLTDYAIEEADCLLTIPMAGMIQSLNISVTAALVLFEITRQRKGGAVLPNSEREKLLESMLSR